MQLSQMLNHALLNTHVQQIWARVPLKSPHDTCDRDTINDQTLVPSSEGLCDTNVSSTSTLISLTTSTG